MCYTDCGLANYTKKYLKVKEQLWKFKYFTMQKYNLQKLPLKETKILQDIIINLQLISSFNTSQNMIFQKSSYKNRPIIYYLGAKIPEATILYNESKHNILALVGKANKGYCCAPFCIMPIQYVHCNLFFEFYSAISIHI